MSYRVWDRFDPRMPSWPGNGTRYGCIFGHDTEGGTGVAGAEGTIQFLLSTPERGASYHEIWAFDEGPGDFTVLGIVPADRAAGSVDPHPPSQGGPYNPDAYARACLGVNADDPNQGGYAVSVAGRVADVDRWSADPRFLAGAKQRLSELSLGIGPELNRIVEHFRLQPSNRSDWGRKLTPALTGQLVPDTALPSEDEVIVVPASDWSRSIANFRGGVSYAFFKPGPGSDPSQWTDRKTYTPSADTQAPADGPWSFGTVGTRMRITAGTFADYFVSSGNMPTFTPEQVATADCTEQVAAAMLAGYADAKGKARRAVEGI